MSELPLTSVEPRELRRRGAAGGGAPRRGRGLRALAILLIVSGALVLADAVVTLLWQEPVSALIATLRQDHLSGALRRVERAPPTPAERFTLANLTDQQVRIAFLAGELERGAPDGSAVGRIVIPRIGASFVMVKGTSTGDLKSGPGIDSEASFPGNGHTTLIAGHRTTYLAPFREIDALSPGDEIVLNMPYAQFVYGVLGHRVVAPTDVSAAVTDVGYSRVVLSACTPLFSAAKRLLVYARLLRTVPRGLARMPAAAAPPPASGPGRAQPARPPLPTVLKPLQPHVLPPFS